VTIKESADGVLTNFQCNSNQLVGSIPDLSSNTLLGVSLWQGNQLIGSIPNLSNNTVLTNFQCHDNQLTGSIPDLSANTALAYFYCYINQLTDFAGGTIKVGTQFNASSNKLTIQAVDAILQGLVDGGTTGAVTINLSGGTNGVPTNTTAIDTLRARGCTVTVN
jgi:Leucine-rich repeat (LRR) protein